jgi:16S rRNA G966 N2-methylase RsmD
MLDLETRVRTNLFPWRGQFSPGLADILLSTYAATGDLVLDPFAGVGTTLVEAARMQLPCTGTEINPAAVAMAETVMFIPLRRQQREEVLQRVQRLFNQVFESHLPLFRQPTAQEPVVARLTHLAQEPGLDQYERNILTNVLIRVADIENEANCDTDAVYRAFSQHLHIVEDLPYAAQEYRVENCDARQLPLADATVDFVLTSPPYINVFNYHQNNRRPMELLGWDLLHVAKSEFGSNRKHRGNRFLTVIQYCLDMHAALLELRRVMRPASRAIFVVGRESCIRGVSFQNGLLVSALAELAGFTLKLRQERKFKNKFGAMIYEDLLHFTPTDKRMGGKSEALSLAVEELKHRLALDLKADIASDIRAAIAASSEVTTSPLYPRRAFRLKP